ncbi:TPA: hypothetical protein ACG4ML_000371 [Stenotrophomonas maltophilia]|uniref:hypothetical protein n=1 Tax=Stenotrophomonas maltophilia TaxID=40324 RepID=UPI001595EF91|nr:hypothetical protein [Stenotrophomonas maltophilia]HDS1366987.1 hypothetical protein [Stenotrophomonas maltophilia]HDS1371791.1 hypothetical protein [Stenotrophomonas maltophilia]HDS1376387.1 hypothetical protein [Stenotrophomonas maltophilia]HDS1381241.1 hypothetical protein [Stenotrophomonas maltophilia]HDS1386015.1 hypothetical protein [Stenotrophomonas maltophilia]
MHYDNEYVDRLKKLYEDHVKVVEGTWLRNLCFAALSAAIFGFAFGIAVGCLIASV